MVESLALQEEPISAFQVRQIQALVLAKIDDENAGQYRPETLWLAQGDTRPPNPIEV